MGEGLRRAFAAAAATRKKDTLTDPLITSRRRPTDAELQQESQITQADIDRAVASFNLHAPPDARGLLEARKEEER